MVKKLVRHGNSMALVIDKPILELMKIDPDTPLEVQMNGRVLTISPVEDPRVEKRFKKAMDKVNRTHRRSLKALSK